MLGSSTMPAAPTSREHLHTPTPRLAWMCNRGQMVRPAAQRCCTAAPSRSTLYHPAAQGAAGCAQVRRRSGRDDGVCGVCMWRQASISKLGHRRAYPACSTRFATCEADSWSGARGRAVHTASQWGRTASQRAAKQQQYFLMQKMHRYNKDKLVCELTNICFLPVECTRTVDLQAKIMQPISLSLPTSCACCAKASCVPNHTEQKGTAACTPSPMNGNCGTNK